MKKYAAELVGAYLLVLFGTGVGLVADHSGHKLGYLAVFFTWALVVMGLIYAIGKLSGCHINPAVSIAFTIAGRFKAAMLPGYIACQLSGALLASFTLKMLFPASQFLGATMPAGSELQSFILEFLLTFFLMLVIMQVAHGSKERGHLGAIVIGTVVGLEAMLAGPYCGASMNPARSIGPAIASGHLEHLWLYIVAPVVGAGLAIPVWRSLNR